MIRTKYASKRYKIHSQDNTIVMLYRIIYTTYRIAVSYIPPDVGRIIYTTYRKAVSHIPPDIGRIIYTTYRIAVSHFPPDIGLYLRGLFGSLIMKCFFRNFFASFWAVFVTVRRSLEAFPYGVRVRSRIAFEHDRGSLASSATSHARPSRISVGTRELYAIQGLGSIFGWLTRPATAQNGLEQGI